MIPIGAVPTVESAPTPRVAPALARSVGVALDRHAEERAVVLPLANPARRLAVIGPLADSSDRHARPVVGRGSPRRPRQVLAGLRDMLPAAQVLHAAGRRHRRRDPVGRRRGARSVRTRRRHPVVRRAKPHR